MKYHAYFGIILMLTKQVAITLKKLLQSVMELLQIATA